MKGMKKYGFILLFVGVLGWFAVVRPQIAAFSQHALEARVKGVEANSYQQRIDDLDVIRSQGAQVSATLQALYLAMPRSAQIPEVLVMIEGIGTRSGVVFSSASVGTASAGEVPVSISFSGDLSSVNSFLDAVNDNVRTAIIKNKSVTSSDLGLMTVNVQMGLVYQGD